MPQGLRVQLSPSAPVAKLSFFRRELKRVNADQREEKANKMAGSERGEVTQFHLWWNEVTNSLASAPVARLSFFCRS